MKKMFEAKAHKGFLACLFRSVFRQKKTPCVYNPKFGFVGRLNYDSVVGFLEKALGRGMTSVEIAALDENFRPQGLLTPDDCYAFKLASRRYRGAYAPEVEFFGTAVGGYADGCPDLELAETVSVHLDNGVLAVDDELVASF